MFDPVADEGTRDEKAALLRELTDEFDDVAVEQSLLEGDDVVDTIVEESENYDVTIVGATRNSRLRQIVLGVIPEEVGRQAQNTTIMAKRYGGFTGGLKARLSSLLS